MRSHLPLAEIGYIQKAIGRRGELKVRFEPEFVPLIPSLRFVFVEIHGLAVPFRVEWIHPHGDDYRLKLKSIDTPEAAHPFGNTPLWVEEALAPKALHTGWRPDKFLPGYTLCDPHGQTLGYIQKVEQYPQQLMLFVEDLHGEVFLVPFVDEWIVQLDRDAHRLCMRLPEGLAPSP